MIFQKPLPPRPRKSATNASDGHRTQLREGPETGFSFQKDVFLEG